MTERTSPTRIAIFVLSVAAAIVAGVAGPGESHRHPDRYSMFFTTSAAVLATILIAVALLAAISSTVGWEVRRSMSGLTIGYLVVGVLASAVATIHGLPWDGYSVLFGIVAGTLFGGVVTIGAMGVVNMRAQDDEAIRSRAKQIGPTGPAPVPRGHQS